MKLTLNIDASEVHTKDDIPIPDVILDLSAHEFKLIHGLVTNCMLGNPDEVTLVRNIDDAYNLLEKYLATVKDVKL